MTDNIEIQRLAQNWDKIAEIYRTIKGSIFSLDERPYLRPIYREFQPYKPKTVVLMCSRKVEKTETGVNLILIPAVLVPHWVGVYTIARSVQVNAFSTERLTEAIGTSTDGVLDRVLKKPTNVHHKQFNISKDGTYFNHLYLYSAWGEGASLLGLAGDYIHVDEAQDMPGVWLPKIMEINALSPHKHMLISGTARDKGDQFDQIWENSDKREWFVQCQSCGAKQQLIFDNIMGPEGQKYKGCRLCKKPLDVRKGKWKPTKDPATSYYVGYHMNQIMHPTITANEIYLKYEMYQSERLFYNEVLGEPYSGGLRPIPIDRILACTSTSHSLLLPREYFDDKPCFLGMDCGLGNHLIIIDENLTWKHLDIIRLKDFSSFDAMIDYIVLLIRSFNVSNAVVDWGDGRNEVTSLQKILGSLVKGCEYKLVDPNDPVHYLETDKSGDYIHRYHADRSATLEKVFWNFKEREFTIPYDQLSRPKVEEFFDHFTNIISNLPDLIENRGKIRAKDSSVLYGATGPDHMCHALNYALIARNMAEDQSISFSKIV